MAGTLIAGVTGLSGVSAATQTADGDTYGGRREVTTVPCDSASLIAALVRADAAGGGVLRLAPHCVYELDRPTGHGRETGGWGGSDAGDHGGTDAPGRDDGTGAPSRDGGPASGPGGGPSSGSDNEPTGQGEGQEVSRPDDRNLLPVINHPITIEGRDAVLTRAPNAGDYRFFTVCNGGELELVDITLDNGRAEQGGALWVEHDASAVITRATFTRNTALMQKDGGGGAVFNDGHMTVVDSTFRDNTAAGAEGQGGGLFNGGVLTVEKSAFVNNSAGGIGGGLANFRGAADVSDTAFVDNHATAGGGLASYSARTKVWDTRAVGNTAKIGGGLANNDATLELRNLDVRRNTATVDGGGISTVHGVLALNASTVTDNTTRGDGSGLYTVRSNTSVRWTEVSRNTGVGAESQGAVYADGGRLNLIDSRIVDNSATTEPGGLFTRNTSLNQDSKTVIAKNRPTDCGPGGSGATRSGDCQQPHGQHGGRTAQPPN